MAIVPTWLSISARLMPKRHAPLLAPIRVVCLNLAQFCRSHAKPAPAVSSQSERAWCDRNVRFGSKADVRLHRPMTWLVRLSQQTNRIDLVQVIRDASEVGKVTAHG